jgi:ankyrin repeat protein
MRNIFGCYPLHLLCCNNYYSSTRAVTFKKLLSIYPAATSYCNSSGDYPLHIACLHNRDWDELKLLLEVSSNILRKQDKAGCYPLHLLCGSCGRFDNPFHVRKVITMWPAALNLPNAIGQTPIHILCRRWNSQVLQDISLYCKDFKLEINIVDHNGNTPLHLVVSNIKEALTQQEVLEFLLDNIFIDTKHQNSNGHHPLDIFYHKLHQLNCISI